MTKEEAIINLKLSQNRIGGIKKEEWNALQMAIEALSVANLKEEFESAGAVHTCNTCADKTLCIMSAPDGNWRACKDYKSAVPNCQKCAIKELLIRSSDSTEKEKNENSNKEKV